MFRLAVACAPPPMQWELVENVVGNQGNCRLYLEMICDLYIPPQCQAPPPFVDKMAPFT